MTHPDGGNPPPAYGAPPGYGPPGAGFGPGYGPGAPATAGAAVAALVLAIASFVFCPFISAVAALFVAGNAKRTIVDSGGTKSGAGMVTAARVIAWVNIVLVVLLVGIIVLALRSAWTWQFEPNLSGS